MEIRSLTIVSTALNAALYAVIGIMTYMGILAPVLGVVRFWPGVFVPAVFAVLFGPIAGGLGAAIGIFLSDMVVHGNPLLSLTVGVPANFVMFYIIGYVSNRKFKMNLRWIFSSIALIIAISLTLFSQWLPWTAGESWVWIVVGAVSIVILAIVGLVWPRWIQYQTSAILGNLVGSLIVGFGVWSFSHFFILPGGAGALPLIAAYTWTVWTFMNQIPFLAIIVPSILKAAYSAFPTRFERTNHG